MNKNQDLSKVQYIMKKKINKNKLFFNKIDNEKEENKLINMERKLNNVIKKLINDKKETDPNIESKVNKSLSEINENNNKHAKIYRKLFLLSDHYGIDISNFNENIYKFYDIKVYGKKWGFVIPGYKLNAYKKNNYNDKLYFPQLYDFSFLNGMKGYYEFLSIIGINMLSIRWLNSNKRKTIYNALLNYMLDIEQNFELSNYIKKDIYLLEMSRFLITEYLPFELPEDREYLAEGAFGKVYIKDNKIYKCEKLRFKDIVNNEGQIIKVGYGIYNYMSSIIFINYIIQHYLYQLSLQNSKEWIPNIYTVGFSYQLDLGVTIMEPAFFNRNNIRKNYTLLHFIKKENKRETFISDFFKILIEICNILIFFQDKCCFVHNDFKQDNILIDYSYDSNSKIKFKLKIIDFGYSSIIIKINGKNYLLKYFNPREILSPNLDNPKISVIWYKKDLFMFITRLLFKTKSNNNREYILNESLKNKLLEIFQIDSDYKTKFSQKLNDIIKIKENEKNLSHFKRFYESIPESRLKLRNIKNASKFPSRYLYYIMLYNKKMKKEVYGNNFNINLFDPRELKKKIGEINLIN